MKNILATSCFTFYTFLLVFKSDAQTGTQNVGIGTITPYTSAKLEVKGVALAAIQQLVKENESLRKRIEALEKK